MFSQEAKNLTVRIGYNYWEGKPARVSRNVDYYPKSLLCILTANLEMLPVFVYSIVKYGNLFKKESGLNLCQISKNRKSKIQTTPSR